MKEFSSSSTSDVFFSVSQSNSGAYAIWKVKDFSALKEEPKLYSSPEFKFMDCDWNLQLYPFRYSDKRIAYVGLYLKPHSSFTSKLDYKFIFKNESEEDFHCKVVRRTFTEAEGWGYKKFVKRQDLLDGTLGNLLPNDVLTICCEMKIVNKLETEKETSADTESKSSNGDPNCGKDSFLSKYREPMDSGCYSDVVLRLGEETFPAHKVILATHSEVFKAMFDSDMAENRDNAVDLVDMDPTVAKAMLLWMYTREVEVLSTEKTLELYAVADRYMLTELKEKCREYVSKHMSSENVGEVFEVAKLHADATLGKAAKNFFASNVRSILKSKKWEEYSTQKSASSVELLSYAIKSNGFLF